MRVVRAPDGTVDFDTTGKAPGRGAYLCADGTCWSTALKRRSIERALEAPLPAVLRARLEAADITTIKPLTPVRGGGIRGT